MGSRARGRPEWRASGTRSQRGARRRVPRGEVALGRAVVEAEAGRIADARRRHGVTHEDDLAASAHQRPERFVGGRDRRADENERCDDERCEDGERSHHETRRGVECSIGGAVHMIGRRQLLHGTVATAVLAAARPAAAAQVTDQARAAMARAAAAFLAALEPDQRRTAVFPFAQDERKNWHYVPRSRSGVAFKQMSAAGRAAAHELIKVSLSGVGYAKAVNVMRLEEVLRQLETFGGLVRDPEKYYASIFGAPDGAAPWGWRLEGHHLSLNFTQAPGRAVSVTPAFFGANPAEVPSGPQRGLRALADEQDLAFALARGVDPSLRARLVIAAESSGDIVSGPGRADSLKTPAGVALGELGAEPRALALRLVETYARNMRSDVADEELRRLRDAGAENLRFAWAGPIDPRQPHY